MSSIKCGSQLIDRDTAVVPRDAFIVTPTHIIQRNSAFGGMKPCFKSTSLKQEDLTSCPVGLSAADAEDLNSYFHFREPTNLQKKSVLEKRRLIASTEFLDPLSEDSPKGELICSSTLYSAVGGMTAVLNCGPPYISHLVDLLPTCDLLSPSSSGSWALRVNRATNLAVLRSLVWPGYHFTHKLGTSDFAGAYFGDGRRNSDLAFMI